MKAWPTLRVTDAYDPDAKQRNPGRPMRDKPRVRKTTHKPTRRHDEQAARQSTVISGGGAPGMVNKLGNGKLRASYRREAEQLEAQAAELLARARAIREAMDSVSYL